MSLATLRTSGLALERTVKQWRWILRIGRIRRLCRRWRAESAHQAASGSKRCLLDLRRIACDGEQGRRFYALVALLERGGYQLAMVPRLRFLQSGHRGFKAAALRKITPYGEDSRPPDHRPFDLCLSDSAGEHPHARQTIRVLTNTRRALRAGDLAMPYGFYPRIWEQNEDADFDAYRREHRRWRLFFGGHCSRESYQRIRKFTRLRCVDRYTVIQQVLDHYQGRTVRIESDEELAEALQRRIDDFVMIDNATYRTESDHWLRLLSRASFFLAAPGCDYPLCHNAIEAMAIGTIPVLEYDSLLTPPLRDGVNCIAYRGREGLKQALARIESLTEAEIGQMRQETIRYYESHLSPTAFCRQLEAESVKRLHLFSYLTPQRCGSRAA